MKRISKVPRVVLILLLLSATYSHGQVEMNRETSDKEKAKKEKAKKKEPDEMTSVFVTANWSKTNRVLKENDGIYGDSLGTRADEIGDPAWSFGIGLRNRIHEYLVWEGGISYMKNGESYSFSDPATDTSFKYQTSYSYVAMPIKVLFTYGDKIQFLAGGGVVPQISVGYKQKQQWTTSLNTSESETVEISRDKINSFVFSAIINAGVQLQMGKRISLLLMPEYKIQLTSTYMKQASYKHHARSLGFNFGLVFHL